MQQAWCWQCNGNVPMFDEAEWAELTPLFKTTLEAQKANNRELFWLFRLKRARL